MNTPRILFFCIFAWFVKDNTVSTSIQNKTDKMKYIEFNVRYDVVGSGVIYLHYTLKDNGNATHGALS